MSFSPYPTAWLVRGAFSLTSYAPHENLAEIKENVTIIEDVTFPSKYKNNKLDIIYPKNQVAPLPVIYWVHGGAFVAGDKDDLTDYMTVLANEGFVIVNINYELAPKAKYPAPLVQLGEAYLFIETSTDTFPFINKDIIYFGGDSAGAHIAAQFVAIQTNPAYLNELKQVKATEHLEKVVDKEIKGALLFAGPYDFDALSNLVKSRVAKKSDNSFLASLISFLAKRVGQGYLGDLKWKSNEDNRLLSIPNYVSSSFPRTFLTDGRKISFEDHSRKLESRLIANEVEVESVYYDYDLVHEYQFNLGTTYDDGNNYAMMTFEKLITFLAN